MKNVKKHLLYIWTIFILILTLYPTPEYNGTVETYYDKVAHVILFGFFSFLYFRSSRIVNRLMRLIVSVSLGLGFSLLIEFLQVYIPGRDASHLDFLAGALGVVVFSTYAFVGSKSA